VFYIILILFFSETLDEHNPWFCPKCGCNQCATKTLMVHRYPKFLIVYLKRYVIFVISHIYYVSENALHRLINIINILLTWIVYISFWIVDLSFMNAQV